MRPVVINNAGAAVAAIGAATAPVVAVAVAAASPNRWLRLAINGPLHAGRFNFIA
jgi:hypothetical protein